jgi:hypothetical protein
MLCTEVVVVVITTVDFNRPLKDFIERENKTVHVTDTAVSLTHMYSNIEGEKITKYENFALKIKSIWKLNNISI